MLPIANQSAHSLAVTAQFGGDYLACRCIGTSIGRACVLCNNTKWLKRCVDCNGSGKTFSTSRPGATPRADIHGMCMGRGWLPCQQADLEIAIAEQAESERAKVAAVVAQVAAPTPVVTPKPKPAIPPATIPAAPAPATTT